LNEELKKCEEIKGYPEIIPDYHFAENNAGNIEPEINEIAESP